MNVEQWLRGLHQQRLNVWGERGVAGCRYKEAADEIAGLRAAL